MEHCKAGDLDLKYLYDGSDGVGAGDSMFWEWRYVHQQIGIKTDDLHKWLPRQKGNVLRMLTDYQVDHSQWQYSPGVAKQAGQHREHMLGTRALITVLIYCATLCQQTANVNVAAWHMIKKMIGLASATVPTKALTLVLLTATLSSLCFSVTTIVNPQGILEASLEDMFQSSRPYIRNLNNVAFRAKGLEF